MHITTIFISCFSAMIATTIAVYCLKPFAEKLGLVDIPGGRKQHETSTPLIGGIAMYIGFCAALFALKRPVDQSLAILSGAGILLIIGVLDDMHEIRKRVRLFGQILATSILIIWGHLSVNHLGNLFNTGNIDLTLHPIIAFCITLIAVLAFINAMNMCDGVDGLAGLLALGQCGLLAFLTIQLGFPQQAYFLFILMALLVTYLAFNLATPWRKKASIFMGDAGSTFIAFIIAWFAVSVSQKALLPNNFYLGYNLVTVLWVLAYPLFDLLSVIILRAKNKKSPMEPGRDHLHHFLLNIQIPRNIVPWVVLMLSIGLGAIGILLEYFKINASLQLLLFISAFLIYLQSVRRLSTYRC